jgi:hypothetical protein
MVEATAEPLIIARLEDLREQLAHEPKRAAPLAPVDFTERRARLQRKRERYLEAFADGMMTRNELREAMSKLDAESLRIDAEEQARRRTNPLVDAAARRTALRQVGAIAKAWAKATPQAKRQIVGHLVTAARIGTGGTCALEWRAIEALTEAT